MTRISLIVLTGLFASSCNYWSNTRNYDDGLGPQANIILANAFPLEEKRTKKHRITIMEQTRPYFFGMEGRSCVLLYWTETDQKSVFCFRDDDESLADHGVS